MNHPFSLFNESQFNRLFPFYILINREQKVIALGEVNKQTLWFKKGAVACKLFFYSQTVHSH